LETTGPGGAFLDYDRDGDLDIYAVNGAYLPGINDPYPAGHDPKKELYNHLYRNNGDGTFTNVALEQGVALGGFGEVTSAMGPTFKDIDNDGDIDIFVINMSGPSILLRNDGGNQNHWLTVRAIGTKSNRDGIGARISLVAGNRRQTAEVIAGEGYLSCNDPRVHFGLGTDSDFQSLKDSGNLKIEIRWPSGIGQTLTNVKVDQILTVTEPNE
jgi:hypothetical protein